MDKRHFIPTLFLFFAHLLNICAQDTLYTIPTGDIAKRDPFVTVDRKAGRYYLITTARNSSESAVALEAYESPDLKMWRRLGFVYHGTEGWMQNVVRDKDHWWAPDTYYYRGRYYTIVTVTCDKLGRVNFCTLLKGGKSPADPYKNVWKDGEAISLTPRGHQCLDGSLYIDEKKHPWLIYSLEWNGAQVQERIGETWAIRLKKNLKGSIGEPIRLFRASEAKWTGWKPGDIYVVDAPFLWKDPESGHLICLWSTFNGTYCVGQAVSRSGRIEGPWEHLPAPIYLNGGHEMVFRDLQGNLKMSLHHNNDDAHLNIVDLKIEDGIIKRLNNETSK